MAFTISPEFQTPIFVADYMISLIDDPEINKVLEPTPGLGNIVNALKENKFDTYFPEGDFWEMQHTMTYDAVVMNPPHTPPAQGYKFLYRCMELSNRVIALMPWFTLINGHKRTCDLLEYGLKSVTHLPRNVFPGSRIQSCVLDLQKGYRGETVFKYFIK